MGVKLTARATAEMSATFGFLGTTTASAWGPWTAAFVQRLRELGWIEGRNLAIEYRWADGRTGRFAEIAAEFVRLKVDVIVTLAALLRPTILDRDIATLYPAEFT